MFVGVSGNGMYASCPCVLGQVSYRAQVAEVSGPKPIQANLWGDASHLCRAHRTGFQASFSVSSI